MNLKSYAPALLRYAMAIVFLLFGVSQIVNPNNFIGYLPNFLFSLSYASTLVVINGVFEVVFGLLLACGIFTRVVSFILAVHLLVITFEVGFTPEGFRDIGLTLATFAITLQGTDHLCIENKWRKRK